MWKSLLLLIAAVVCAHAQATSRLTPATYSDANILALLDEANEADSTAAAFVVGRATNSDVRNFAQLMMSEHHMLRQPIAALAKQLNIIPVLPSPDPVHAAADSEISMLEQVGSTSGADTARAADTSATEPGGGTAAIFDKTYIDEELRIHRAVIDLATNVAKQTKNQQIKKLIHDALPYFQRHLSEAQRVTHALNRSQKT